MYSSCNNQQYRDLNCLKWPITLPKNRVLTHVGTSGGLLRMNLLIYRNFVFLSLLIYISTNSTMKYLQQYIFSKSFACKLNPRLFLFQMTQIAKILNAHMDSLQWVDQNTCKSDSFRNLINVSLRKGCQD